MFKWKRGIYTFKTFQGGWISFKSGGGRRNVALTISSNQTTLYNIFTAAGSPGDIVDVTLTINSGISVGSGMTTGDSSAPTSTIKIINLGNINGWGVRVGAEAVPAAVVFLDSGTGKPGENPLIFTPM